MGTNFQSIDVHLADSSNNTEGRNNFNNNSLSHYDSTIKLQQGGDKIMKNMNLSLVEMQNNTMCGRFKQFEHQQWEKEARHNLGEI